LLPVVDTLERTLTDDPAHSTERLDGGVESTLRQLMQVVHQHGGSPAGFKEQHYLALPWVS
jgi:molecular chaperone GrpE (heat shock protein)